MWVGDRLPLLAPFFFCVISTLNMSRTRERKTERKEKKEKEKEKRNRQGEKKRKIIKFLRNYCWEKTVHPCSSKQVGMYRQTTPGSHSSSRQWGVVFRARVVLQ